ncbi:hypothetical protein GCM10009594_07560 [Kocuria palustris]
MQSSREPSRALSAGTPLPGSIGPATRPRARSGRLPAGLDSTGGCAPAMEATDEIPIEGEPYDQ